MAEGEQWPLLLYDHCYSKLRGSYNSCRLSVVVVVVDSNEVSQAVASVEEMVDVVTVLDVH